MEFMSNGLESHSVAVLVYENKDSGEIRVMWLDDARVFDADESWDHIGSLNPRAYINWILTEYPALVRKMKGENV